MKQLAKICEPGAEERNTDLTDRGYLLSKILEHIDASIWAKIQKDDYVKKFIEIDESHSQESLY